MGLLDFVPVIGPALNAASGLFSESNARSAFKSRYQDTVADMRAAGLNPALAYGQGGGNPTTVPLPQVGSDISDTIQQMASAKQAKQAAANQAAQADLTTAQAALLKAQTADLISKTFWENQSARENSRLTSSRADLTATQARVATGTAPWDIINAKAAAQLQELGLPGARAEANFYDSRWGKISPYITSAGQAWQSFMPKIGLNLGRERISTKPITINNNVPSVPYWARHP